MKNLFLAASRWLAVLEESLIASCTSALTWVSTLQEVGHSHPAKPQQGPVFLKPITDQSLGLP